MIDLSVNLCGVTLKNPVIPASGTFGFGHEYSDYYDLSELGGISVKGLTLLERPGNKPPRIAETPNGILNSVGLQNPGVDAFIAKELPYLRQFDTKIIANISGNSVEDYCVMVDKLCAAGVDMIEVNVSCPNVRAGGKVFGTDPDMVKQITKGVKAHTNCPFLVKLSPNVTDITEIAKAAESEGADGIALINTLLGMRIDINSRKPILGNIMGGMSGPAVLPIAVRMVYQVSRAVKIPVLGMGGISSGEDAVEMLLAGATAVSVGTACLVDPYAPIKIRDGIAAYMEKYGVKSVSELTGAVRV